MVKRSRARCPFCGEVAIGRPQIEKRFGIRDMSNGSKHPYRVQSWCRKCR